jgi:hypothetical protein
MVVPALGAGCIVERCADAPTRVTYAGRDQAPQNLEEVYEQASQHLGSDLEEDDEPTMSLVIDSGLKQPNRLQNREFLQQEIADLISVKTMLQWWADYVDGIVNESKVKKL